VAQRLSEATIVRKPGRILVWFPRLENAMKLPASVVFVLLSSMLGPAAPALAMTTGTPADGEGHPAVVSLMWSPDGVWTRTFCSGMLLSGRVVLTASHCVAPALRAQQSGWQIMVSNDSRFQVDSNG
jgi:hypothetical protein